jgi:hypothetical protein
MGVCRIALLALLFAGCGGDTAAAALQGKVTYAKSGGIAGLVQKLTVSPNGRAVAASVERKRSFTLSAGQLKRLTRYVRGAKLAETRDPKPNTQGADAFAYRVGYRGDAVRWDDFTDDPPRRVMVLYRFLDELYTAHAPCNDGRSC